MVKISDFSNVLSIAFGFNAVFYIFDVAPMSDKKLSVMLDQYQALVDRKIELTQNSEVFPLSFYVDGTYAIYNMLLKLVTIITSLFCLGILIYIGFYPDSYLPGPAMIVILIILFGVVPSLSTIIYFKATKFIRMATEQLQQIINKAESEIRQSETTT